LLVHGAIGLERRDHRSSRALKSLLCHRFSSTVAALALRGPPLQLDIIHCIDAFTSAQPPCCCQRAQCIAAAALCSMPQFDRVGFGIKAYSMRTGKETRTSGRNVEHVRINFSVGWSCQSLFFPIDILGQYTCQSKRSSAGAIRLLAMVYFVDVGVIVCGPV